MVQRGCSFTAHKIDFLEKYFEEKSIEEVTTFETLVVGNQILNRIKKMSAFLVVMQFKIWKLNVFTFQ
jgi:hypothetical protein